MSKLEQLNTVAVAPELLRGTLETVIELAYVEERSETEIMAAVTRSVEQATGSNDSALNTAIYVRLVAVCQLAMSGQLGGHIQPGANGLNWWHEDIFRCAATLPIIAHDGAAGFDPERFSAELQQIDPSDLPDD